MLFVKIRKCNPTSCDIMGLYVIYTTPNFPHMCPVTEIPPRLLGLNLYLRNCNYTDSAPLIY